MNANETVSLIEVDVMNRTFCMHGYNLSPDDGWNTYQNFTTAFERAVDPNVNPYVLGMKEKGFRQENEGYPWYYMCPYSEEINGEIVFVGCRSPEECEDEFKGAALEI